MCSDPLVIYEKFNLYFTSIPMSIHSTLPYCSDDFLYLIRENFNSCYFGVTCPSEVWSVISDLVNTKCNVEEFSVKMLKIGREIFSEVICDI